VWQENEKVENLSAKGWVKSNNQWIYSSEQVEQKQRYQSPKKRNTGNDLIHLLVAGLVL
jgi:hypothetical protein